MLRLSSDRESRPEAACRSHTDASLGGGHAKGIVWYIQEVGFPHQVNSPSPQHIPPLQFHNPAPPVSTPRQPRERDGGGVSTSNNIHLLQVVYVAVVTTHGCLCCQSSTFFKQNSIRVENADITPGYGPATFGAEARPRGAVGGSWSSGRSPAGPPSWRF